MGSVLGNLNSNKKWELVKTECQKWSLSTVIEARNRFALEYRKFPSPVVERKIFWEVFTDYDPNLVEDGSFLSLPLEVYDLFEKQSDKTIDIREIFCLLAILCKGSILSAKLKVIFPLFGSFINEERITQILRCYNRALVNLGVLENTVPSKYFINLSSRICGEGAWRKCKTVSPQLLGDWILNCEELSDVCSILLTKAEKKAAQKGTLMRTKVEIESTGSAMKSSAKKLLESSKELQQLKTGKKPHKPAKSDDFVVQQQLKKERQEEMKKKREEAKMKKAQIMGKNTVKSIGSEGLKKIKARWASFKPDRKGLPRDKFAELMSAEFPAFSDRYISSQLFNVFDKNNDGFITFEELTVGVGRITAGSFEDKIAFLFEAFAIADADSNQAESQMKISEVIKIVQNANNELMECAHFVELLITMMDYDKNGRVDREEFRRGAREIPKLLECFSDCLRPTGKIKSSVIALNESIPAFNVAMINKAWVELGPRRAEFTRVGWDRFLSFMTSIWDDQENKDLKPETPNAETEITEDEETKEDGGPETDEMSDGEKTGDTKEEGEGEEKVSDVEEEKGDDKDESGISYEEIYELLQRLFKSADKDSSSQKVDLRRLLVGIMDILGVKKEDEAETEREYVDLYFNLFDLDGSGDVEYLEFFEMLYSAQLDLQDSSWQTVETLRLLDEDGNGLVSKEEFVQAVKTNPVIFDCFSRIFCASEENIDTEEQETENGSLGVSASAPELREKPHELEIMRLSSSVELPLSATYKTTYIFKGDNSPRAPVNVIPAGESPLSNVPVIRKTASDLKPVIDLKTRQLEK